MKAIEGVDPEAAEMENSVKPDPRSEPDIGEQIQSITIAAKQVDTAEQMAEAAGRRQIRVIPTSEMPGIPKRRRLGGTPVGVSRRRRLGSQSAKRSQGPSRSAEVGSFCACHRTDLTTTNAEKKIPEFATPPEHGSAGTLTQSKIRSPI
eukprot:GHVP01023449.1.p1 GENE.GHVP01023449.1~~GHVP01023449.1.p1  ORF type:complete len:149 (-),score=27.29 GHVP01023449.1:309-755(-)